MKLSLSNWIEMGENMSVLTRGYHFGQRIAKGLEKFPEDLKQFGIEIARIAFFDSLVPPEKGSKYIAAVEEYVEDYLESLIIEYKNKTYVPSDKLETKMDQIPVWCCWWQGVENMPELVRMCNDRLRHVLPSKAKLYMITEENYQEYVKLPEHVLKKFEEGKMSITALSDILRVALLSEYGGFWIDSTVFISGKFPEDFISNNFYAQRMYDPQKWCHEACKGRWCGFMMAGSEGNIIFQFLRDAFYKWWKDYDRVIDYVILDYFLLAAYHNIPVVQQMIDSVPDNNVDVFEMYKVLHLPYSDELFSNLTKTTVMHKLTYKIDLYKKTESGDDTLYGKLLKQVNEE